MPKQLNVTVLLVLVPFGGWLVVYSVRDSDRDQTKTPSVEPQSGPSSYYVFDYVDAAGEYQDGGPMGSVDKVGVAKATDDVLANRTADYLFMGGQTSDREQFLTNAGHTFKHAQPVWDTRVGMHGIVNEKDRLAVFVRIGVDAVEAARNASFVDIDRTLFEIWELGNPGSDPVLLDRSLTSFDGVKTHAEVPVPVYQPPTNAGDLFGTSANGNEEQPEELEWISDVDPSEWTGGGSQ